MSVVPDGVDVGYFIDDRGQVTEVSGKEKIEELVADEKYPFIVYWSLDALESEIMSKHRVVLGYDQYGKEVEDEESVAKGKAAFDKAISKKKAIS